MTVKQMDLYYKDGGSDKVYHAQIEEKDGGYIVNFQYGKRNSTLATGCKTAAPVELAKAQAIFDKLKKEKEAKGYTTGESGAIFQSQSLEDRTTGIYPQLPVAFKGEEEDLATLFASNEWVMQEKIDGQHLITKKTGQNVLAINKKGLSTVMPQTIEDQLNAVLADAVFDGEIIGEKYYMYDLMEFGGEDLRKNTVEERMEKLLTLPIANMVIPTYRTEAEKRAAFEKFKKAKKEGVVFKKVNAPYVPGKPASKGNHIKFRFFETSTFHVTKHTKNARSVEVSVYDETGKQHALGKVTIPVNFDVPEIGSIVEVRYVHCFIGGSLYHSTYVGPRTDQDIVDCTLSQIKFKPENTDDTDD